MKQVLFVDDERSVLAALERALRPHRDRWSMTFVRGAAEALAHLELGHVDVVVTDLRMPGMDGAAFLDIVRAQHPDTARIVLSGEVETASATRLAEAVDRWLTKPCGADVLINALEQVAALR